MQIEAGKFYRTRDGRKVGPMREDPNYSPRPFDVDSYFPAPLGRTLWTRDGESDEGSNLDLVAEWLDPVDLTALTTPFGLLDEVYGPGTQEALKAHGGPYEVWSNAFGGSWVGCEALWVASCTYRVKTMPPTPPQPRTLYLCEFRDGERSFHATAIDATKAALSYGHGATVSEWREVLE